MSTTGPSKEGAPGEPGRIAVGEPSRAEPPALPPPEPAAVQRPALSPQRIWHWMMLVWKTVVTTATSLSAVALFVWIGVLVAGETMQRGSIVIDAIAVPKKLADDGYTSDVVAQKLRDAVGSIMNSAHTRMRTAKVQLTTDRPTVTIPATGLSVESIAAFIRNFLGLEAEHEVSGDFAIAKDVVLLRLRMNGKVFYSSRTQPDLGEMEKVIQAAASAIVDEVQPYINAVALLDSDPERAVAVADGIIARLPETDENVAWCHNLKGNVAKSKSNLEEAIAEYRTAIRLKPKLPLPHDNLGLALQTQGKVEQAVVEFHETMRLDSRDAEPHIDLGHLLAGQGKPDEAIAEYRLAMRLDPKDDYPHIGLGEVLAGQGKPDEAIAEYREAIRLVPKDANPHISFGNLLSDQGKPDEAAAEYRAAIRLDPKSADPHNGLGNLLSEQGKPDEAAAEYRAAIGLDPKSADPHNGLGNLLSKQGKPDEAAAEYREAIHLNPKLTYPHNGLGNLLSDQGKPDEAIAEYREAIRLDPKSALPHNNLGDLLKAQGKLDEAIAEWHEAIRLDPKNAGPFLDLGLALRDQGVAAASGPSRSQKLKEACEAFTQGAKLAPGNTDYAARIGEIDRQLAGGAHCPPR